MNCGKARQAWRESCDAPLKAPRAWQLDAHLRACPKCRTFVAQMQTLDAGLAALRTESEDVASARFGSAAVPQAAPLVRDRPLVVPVAEARRERIPARPTFRRAVRFAIAAAILMAAGVALYSTRQPGPGRMDGPQVAGSSRPKRPTPAVIPTLPDAPRVVLRGATAADFLLVSEKSRHPRVHIFRLHAIYRLPDDGAAIEPALAAAGSESSETGS
jgi:hypothetical protein